MGVVACNFYGFPDVIIYFQLMFLLFLLCPRKESSLGFYPIR